MERVCPSGIYSIDNARRDVSIKCIALCCVYKHANRITVTSQYDGSYIDARTRSLNPKPALAGHLGTAGAGFPIVWNSTFY